MEFMKRALQRQREEARQEAEKLIQALQEEEELNEESENEEREEETKPESEETMKIREALAGGVVRRAKHGSKSLEVKDKITIQPLFETPEVPSLFEESVKSGENVGSRLVEELEEESEEGVEDVEDAEDAEDTEDAEDADLLGDEGENPWLVEGGGDKSRENEEDEVDVEATVANLEVGVSSLTML